MALERAGLLMAPDEGRAPARSDRQWLLAVLPAFPLLLLTLRLWYLSRQDGQTMLLLLQYVSPLGLVSSLLASTVWAVPATLLLARLLGLLLRVSTGAGEPEPLPGPLRLAAQAPGWLVALSVALAAATWQLRFLPSLAMVALIATALRERLREQPRAGGVGLVGTVFPLAGAAVLTFVFAPVAAQAWTAADVLEGRLTALVLLGPPLLAPLLTGPVPAAFAASAVRPAATALALGLPLVVGAVFIRTPVLPTVAVEIGTREPVVVTEVVRGSVITTDDLAVTLLDEHGGVRFIDNDLVVSRTLCPDSAHIPSTPIALHGWSVEHTALEWLAPPRGAAEVELPCLGRSRQQRAD